MRCKRLFLLSLLCLCCLCVGSRARAEEQRVQLAALQLQADFPSGWLLITPEKASKYAALLDAASPDVAESTMRSEGVALVAYAPSSDVYLRIFTEETADTRVYFDIERYTAAQRAEIRSEYLHADVWALTGLRYTAAEWKNTKACGRLLRLTYTLRRDEEIVARGLQAYTLHNGRAYTFEMQANGRRLTAAEKQTFEVFLKSLVFAPALPMPMLPLSFTLRESMPEEPLDASFKLRGATTQPGVTLTALIQETTQEPVVVGETTAGTSGAFTLPVTLPGKGAWTFYLRATLEGFTPFEQTSRLIYDPDRIPFSLASPLEGEIWDAQPLLLGKTLPGVTLEVRDGETFCSARTGSDGVFRIKLAKAPAGERHVRVTLLHKTLPTRELSYSFTRCWHAADYRAYIADQVQPLSYANLIGQPAKYVGRLVRYAGCVQEISASGSKTYVRIATKQNKQGEWTDEIVCTLQGEVALVVEDLADFYATVTGNTYSFPLAPTAEKPDGGTQVLPELSMVLSIAQ